MLGVVVSEAHKRDDISSLDLAVIPWMVCCYCQVTNTKGGAHLWKAFADEFSTIVGKDVSCDAKKDEPMIE